MLQKLNIQELSEGPRKSPERLWLGELAGLVSVTVEILLVERCIISDMNQVFNKIAWNEVHT